LSLPVLEWRSVWASYPPPFSSGDPNNLSFAPLSILLYFLLYSTPLVRDSSYLLCIISIKCMTSRVRRLTLILTVILTGYNSKQNSNANILQITDKREKVCNCQRKVVAFHEFRLNFVVQPEVPRSSVVKKTWYTEGIVVFLGFFRNVLREYQKAPKCCLSQLLQVTTDNRLSILMLQCLF
jgi:hypothetical protein